MPSYIYGDYMTKQTRPRFNPELKVEAAQLVLDQGYSVKEAAQVMGVGLSTLDKWVWKLKNEREGQLTPMLLLQNKEKLLSSRNALSS